MLKKQLFTWLEGDFNCIIEASDRIGEGGSGTLDSSSSLLVNIIKEESLREVWAGEKDYTRTHPSGKRQSRTDLVLVSKEIEIRKTVVISVEFSDH